MTDPEIQDDLEATRKLIVTQGADALTVDDLRNEDLSRIAWSGKPNHVKYVAQALDRAVSGYVDYLAVRGSPKTLCV